MKKQATAAKGTAHIDDKCLHYFQVGSHGGVHVSSSFPQIFTAFQSKLAIFVHCLQMSIFSRSMLLTRRTKSVVIVLNVNIVLILLNSELTWRAAQLHGGWGGKVLPAARSILTAQFVSALGPTTAFTDPTIWFFPEHLSIFLYPDHDTFRVCGSLISSWVLGV